MTTRIHMRYKNPSDEVNYKKATHTSDTGLWKQDIVHILPSNPTRHSYIHFTTLILIIS